MLPNVNGQMEHDDKKTGINKNPYSWGLQLHLNVFGFYVICFMPEIRSVKVQKAETAPLVIS